MFPIAIMITHGESHMNRMQENNPLRGWRKVNWAFTQHKWFGIWVILFRLSRIARSFRNVFHRDMGWKKIQDFLGRLFFRISCISEDRSCKKKKEESSVNCKMNSLSFSNWPFNSWARWSLIWCFFPVCKFNRRSERGTLSFKMEGMRMRYQILTTNSYSQMCPEVPNLSQQLDLFLCQY